MGIVQKLPEGKIFQLEESTEIYKLLKSFKENIDSAKTTAKNTITDLNPLYVTNFFDEWARLLNLEAEFVGKTDAQKRALIVSKLTESTPRSASYYINLILTESGYTATIDDYFCFQAGSSEAGEPVLTPDDLDNPNHTIIFRIQTSDNKTEIGFTQAGEMQAGDRLQIFGIPLVEKKVVNEFPLINNLVFIYDDGSYTVRSF